MEITLRRYQHKYNLLLAEAAESQGHRASAPWTRRPDTEHKAPLASVLGLGARLQA